MQEPESEELLERQFALTLKNEPETSMPDCLTPERMIALAERSLPEAETAKALAHAALCSRCRREYAETAELLQLSQDVAAKRKQDAPPVSVRKRRIFPAWQPRFAPGAGFAFGAAIAGMALFFAFAVPARRERDQLALELKTQETQAARVESQKNALNRELAARRQAQGNDSRLAAQASRLKAINARQNLQIAQLSEADDVLRETPLPEAAWKLKLSEAQTQTRGNGDAGTATPEISPLRPVETAITETRPILEFRQLAGAMAYQVRLEIVNSNEECPAPVALSPTRWQSPAALRPGQIYQWEVTAQRGGKSVHSAPAKFYILSLTENREIAQARKTYAKNPLALGIVYARSGLRDEAAAQFRAALKANPAQAAAKRWLQETQAQAGHG